MDLLTTALDRQGGRDHAADSTNPSACQKQTTHQALSNASVTSPIFAAPTAVRQSNEMRAPAANHNCITAADINAHTLSLCPASHHKSWSSFLEHLNADPTQPLDLSCITDTTLFTNPGGSRSARLIRAVLHIVQSQLTPEQFQTVFDFSDHVVSLDLKPDAAGNKEYKCEAYRSIRGDTKIPALVVKTDDGHKVLTSTRAILSEISQRAQTALLNVPVSLNEGKDGGVSKGKSERRSETKGEERSIEALNMSAHNSFWQSLVATHDSTNFPPVMGAFKKACSAQDPAAKRAAIEQFAENEAIKWNTFYDTVANQIEHCSDTEIDHMAETAVGLFVAITSTGMDRVIGLDTAFYTEDNRAIKPKFETVLAKFNNPASKVHQLIDKVKATEAFKASDSQHCATQ